MHGDIDGGQLEPDDPVNIPVRHIGERHIIPLQKRKPGIIILKIQRLPHPFWHLVNKAENTLVLAGAVLTHEPILKSQPQILVVMLDLQLPLLPIFFFHHHDHGLAAYIVLIIKNIFDLVSIYGQKPVPRLQPQLLPNGPRIHSLYPMPFPHNMIPFFSLFYRKLLTLNRQKIPDHSTARLHLT